MAEREPMQNIQILLAPWTAQPVRFSLAIALLFTFIYNIYIEK